MSELPKNTAENHRDESVEAKFDSVVKKPQRQSAQIIAVGRKDLRLMEQSYWHGSLSYAGQTSSDGGVDIELKVQLPPDGEERLMLHVAPEESGLTLKAVRRAIKHAIIDQYVFPNLDKTKEDNKERKGLTENEIHIFRLIAQEILSALQSSENKH